MSVNRQYCTFKLDKHYFGVEVVNVQEVFRFQEMTSVPLAPSIVRGLINLRGQIITAIDLRAKLRFDPLPEGEEPMNVVVRTDDGAVSLLVDEIGDVIEVSDDSFEQAPETLNSETRELVQGVYKLDGRLLLILDSEKVLQSEAVSE